MTDDTFEPRVAGYGRDAFTPVIDEPPKETDQMTAPVDPSESEPEMTGPLGMWTFPILTRIKGLQGTPPPEDMSLGQMCMEATAGHEGLAHPLGPHAVGPRLTNRPDHQHVY